jgi:formylglycine-generating enzyme required for sulfatase activity
MRKTIQLPMIIMIGATWCALAGCDKHAQAPAGPSTSCADVTTQLPATQLDLGNNIKIKLLLIPAGKFMMGSPNDEQDRQDDEGPLRQVTITKSFYIGVYPVTQEQYEQVMAISHSRFRESVQNPVETTTWDEAVAFCNKLSQRTGKKVHLPTEAQWEYACRAGTTTRYSFGDKEETLDDYGWSQSNSKAKTHPVGEKKPNPWGLYDMHGNVWQWCSDWYADSYKNASNEDPQGPGSGRGRVLRGGSWYLNRLTCRSAFRAIADPYGRVNGFAGLRVVMDVDDCTPATSAPAPTSAPMTPTTTSAPSATTQTTPTP